jgi:hypothetical protein
MRTLALSSLQSSRTTQRVAIVFAILRTRPAVCASVLLVSGILALAQDSTEPVDKAPAPIDEALRARVDQYYHAFITGKYKDAYLLVDDDSQDAFLEADKQPYQACETLKIRYSDNFTKASVLESCKGDWKWHGHVTPMSIPLTSSWVVVNGQWYWHYVKPTQRPFPFSPTGVTAVPSGETEAKKDGPVIPADLNGLAKAILAKVGLDKQTIHLRRDVSSQDVIHVRNGMPGVITLKLDDLGMAGLKITVGKTQLQAHEETTILFEWRLDDPVLRCQDCAGKTPGSSTVQLHIAPTGQAFPISVVFEQGPQAEHPVSPPGSLPPQK